MRGGGSDCSFFLSSLIYPVIAHIVWSQSGLFGARVNNSILGTDGILDNAGSLVVHVTGGTPPLGPRGTRTSPAPIDKSDV